MRRYEAHRCGAGLDDQSIPPQAAKSRARHAHSSCLRCEPGVQFRQVRRAEGPELRELGPRPGRLPARQEILDPRASRSLDSAVGINNTSIFGEIMWANLNGFGNAGSLYVGTTTFIGGLSLEF